jgi:hypothetical protein
VKITGLETICLSRPHEVERQWFTASCRTIKADCSIVLIRIDEGLQGIGEASHRGWPLSIHEIAAPVLVGKGRLHRLPI